VPMSENRVKEIQKEVEDVKEITRENVNKLVQNNEKLDVLQNKTDEMQKQSDQFKKQSKTLERMECCKNAKLTIIIALIIGGIVVFLILVVVVPVAVTLKKQVEGKIVFYSHFLQKKWVHHQPSDDKYSALSIIMVVISLTS